MPLMTTDKGDFGKTMRLPQTAFGMRANLAENEPKWVARWLDEDVYGKVIAARRAANARGEGVGYFHVHLGPPYANGNFHMGHTIPYVVKDFIVRHKLMAGYESPYTAGWDCHGLPIEWKVEQEIRKEGKTKHDISKKELRARCRAYARGWVDTQLAEWQRFGCMADWDGHYETMAPQNEAGIVRELGKLVQRGLVSQKLRSTQWSWAEETALAEAEVEYAEKTSEAIYVALPLVGRKGGREEGSQEFLVIWTTTPWTLPANRAVAVDKSKWYVGIEYVGKTYWVAEELAKSFIDVMKWEGAVIGKPLLGGEMTVSEAPWMYEHPLYADVTGRVVHGDHVTTESGTGLVHIAPAHGAEDFNVGVAEGLDLKCPVDGAGKYESWVPPLADGAVLAGKLIWPMQKEILRVLGDKLLKHETITHSYPVSWRSKEKLIFRSTPQWFVGMDVGVQELGGKTLRDAALDRIYARGVKGVEWLPESGQNRIGNMIAGRPDWCISRQRAWGVPITIMQWKRDGALVADAAVWEHIAQLVAREGIDAWDDRLGGREAELFPAGWLAAHGATVGDFSYVTDILDVWFDSGTTHAHVVRNESAEGQRFHRTDGKRPADLYQEGSDQHRGWFHSSLLTSVANYGDAPYEAVLTSGFVVDGEGRKFSKSLGNGVEPRTLLKEFGMDIIRLWVARSDYREDVRYSPALMSATAEDYRKFRNTLRWLLGNLNGYEGGVEVAYAALPELERYVLHRWATVSAAVRGHYERYEFWKAYQLLYGFVSGDLSNLYFDARKDVLYCDPAGSADLRACQQVLDVLLKGLLTHLAPLMPFTTDEAWRSRNRGTEEQGDIGSVHLETYAVTAVREDAGFEVRWEQLLSSRELVNKDIEHQRNAGIIKGNIEGAVVGPVAEKDVEVLREILGVSQVKSDMNSATFVVARMSGHKCGRCWRYYDRVSEDGLCLRCEHAVNGAVR